MARHRNSPSPSSSGHDDEQSADEKEEVQHDDSIRGNTPLRYLTPIEHINDKVPTPPPSPPTSTVQVSVAPIPPPVSSQPISSTPSTQPATTVSPPPPVSTIPISTTPLRPPIFSQAASTTTPITTTSPNSPVIVNVSDTGANTETDTPVTPKPLSPSPSSDSAPTLGGDNFEFDSTYYSPYRLPSDEDNEALVTQQQLQDSIDKSTKAVDDSTSLYKKATTDVEDLIQDSKIFLDSFKGHADTNAAKVNDMIDSLSQSLYAEEEKFDTVRSEIQTKNHSLNMSVNSRLEKLHADLAMENKIMDDLARKTTQIEVQKVQLSQVDKRLLH
ncbi:hypothetical protein Lser_V15G45356 [Lactuca serriola]